MTAWHTLSADDALRQLKSDSAQGLSADDVVARQQRYGANELVEFGGRGPLRIVCEQLVSAMVGLLAAAAVVSVYLGELTDAAAIVAIILLNAALGFFQDYRAERALAALKRLAVPTIKVRRQGDLQEISAKQLVPGDIVQLEVGKLVPADCRLIESTNVRAQEASLTGESEPVEKFVEAIAAQEVPLGDRANMVFMGTLVSYGHGLGLVTETGMSTQLGQIARSLQTVKPEPTPLQQRLAQLGRSLAIVSLAIVALVFALGVVMGESPRLMLMTALSLAVAIVPEGLPAVATVALALGARRMFRRRALIRRLPAVETLGSVTVICSDKTGTLTENRMTVMVLDVAGHRVELTESYLHDAYRVADDAPADVQREQQLTQHPSLDLLLAGAALCNDAELLHGSGKRLFRALGEPTEAALVVAAARMGLTKPELLKHFPRVDEVPFDSQRKRMTTVHRVGQQRSGPEGEVGGKDKVRSESPTIHSRQVIALLQRLNHEQYVGFMKGAVDVVLGCCQRVWTEDRTEPLDDDRRRRIMQSNDQLAASGMRVLGVAFRPCADQPRGSAAEDIERDMIFVGILGLIDPPRPEVSEAVARCRTAGIRPIMITGDHPLTALHIARQLGIADQDRTLVGHELADMSAADLEPLAADVPVYARVAPKDKLHIVQALQNKGQVVAMTGDGVNDAPALRQAHIGVAMGVIGTDVSKEAADMVLLDDNFATIVNAVEEGRVVYDNIRKFVKYTMTSNAGEVWVMVLGPLLGMPLPLLPLQILWVNLVTDGLPGLALAVEPAERDTMRRPPYPPQEHIMGRGMWRDIAWIGLLMAVTSLAMGYARWAEGTWAEPHWRTIVFTVLTLSQMGNALAIRSAHDSLFKIGLFSNRALLGSVLLTFALQMAVIYLPPLQAIFKTAPLLASELLVCLLMSTSVFWAVELQKKILRTSTRKKGLPAEAQRKRGPAPN
jgi:Ca2+-transporting ATPase